MADHVIVVKGVGELLHFFVAERLRVKPHLRHFAFEVGLAAREIHRSHTNPNDLFWLMRFGLQSFEPVKFAIHVKVNQAGLVFPAHGDLVFLAVGHIRLSVGRADPADVHCQLSAANEERLAVGAPLIARIGSAEDGAPLTSFDSGVNGVIPVRHFKILGLCDFKISRAVEARPLRFRFFFLWFGRLQVGAKYDAAVWLFRQRNGCRRARMPCYLHDHLFSAGAHIERARVNRAGLGPSEAGHLHDLGLANRVLDDDLLAVHVESLVVGPVTGQGAVWFIIAAPDARVFPAPRLRMCPARADRIGETRCAADAGMNGMPSVKIDALPVEKFSAPSCGHAQRVMIERLEQLAPRYAARSGIEPHCD